MARKFFVVLAIFAFSLSARAAELSKDFRAVIAAPKEIQLAKTSAFSVLVSLQRLGEKKPLPPKIKLWSTRGRFEVEQLVDGRLQKRTGYGPLEIDTPSVTQTVTILLEGYVGTETFMRVDVTTTEGNYELLGSAEIKLRGLLGKFEFIEVPRIIAADGRSTGEVKVRVTDQQGEPIDNFPFILRGSGPHSAGGKTQDIVVAATTDKDGYATFVLPPFASSGIALLQVIGQGAVTEQIVTRQLEIHYQDDPNRREEWIIKDSDWWKKPILWT